MEKTCNGCGKTQPFSAFYPKTGARGTKYSTTAAGYAANCKACDRKARHLYVVNNPDKSKVSDRGYHLSKYGLDVNGYNELFDKQNGTCPGCQRHQMELNKRLCVDHCHKTGEVRGLLCHSCNSLLGMARDNVSTLNNLITYLTNFSESAANECNTDTKVG